MPKRNDIKKIMVIGSGPIIIGHAAEFDYAGTQACLALKVTFLKLSCINHFHKFIKEIVCIVWSWCSIWVKLN